MNNSSISILSLVPDTMPRIDYSGHEAPGREIAALPVRKSITRVTVPYDIQQDLNQEPHA